MKKIIATIMTLALLLGLCSITAMAADDIVLNGDAGASSLIGEYSASAPEYKYLGFATTKEATSDYKYLQLTYSGDISTLRIEFNKEDDSNVGPYWFTNDQVKKFVTVDGSAIPTNPSSDTTIVLDLSKIGINIGDFRGLHLHYLSPDLNSASFKITDARLMTSPTSAGTSSDSAAPAAPSNDDNASKSTTPANNNSGAANTGSTSVPTVIACLVVLFAGAVLVYSKKRA